MSAVIAFTTIRTEGAILPPDILIRIAAGDKDLGGLTEAAYHLTGEKFGEATNRAWNRLQSSWLNFQTARENLAAGDAGTTVARERWLLPLFQLLDYGRLQITKTQEIGSKTYAISHSWQHVPIHLVGCNVDLDSRHRGTSPHSLLQEFLNRSEGHLWGIVSNGLRLRLLRDNISLTRQAYVEFDLEAMMAGEAYPDFVLLWLLLHQSRFEGERPELAWIEKWSQAARTEGVRVLEGLRHGVQRAIESLGQGALAHPANTSLREALRDGALDKQDFYRELLRLVYRIIFLFVAEDRNLLLDPSSSAEARERYTKHYAVARIRRLAISKAGSRHDDLYRALKFVMTKLSSNGCAELALPALGSFLFSPNSMPRLDSCEISNRDLLAAVRSLAVTQTKQGRRGVDYKNLGAEELGSVYESLLELHPAVDTTAALFELRVTAGSERKTSGSYYTPSSLISCLLDSALDPVLNEASNRPNPEAAILKLKVVDPACGSGHFLIAAAHRIAKRLAAVRTSEEEPPPEAQRKALRNVISHSIYGVDVNPMAVELCKVSLWMEALEPGKPLSFLEHRIQCGNSLLGATPALLTQGITDEAFTPIEGDEKEICKEFKRINKDERNKQMRLFAATTEPWQQLGKFAASLMSLDTVDDDSIEAIREKERMYEEAIRSGNYLDDRFWADTWCAAFVWKKTREFNYPITEGIFRRIERNPHNCEPWMRTEIARLSNQYHFFHWHLAFPDVFRLPSTGAQPERSQTGSDGGFDVVLGNPPWERIKIQEKEWFASRRPDISDAPSAAERQQKIDQLAEEDPPLYRLFLEECRRAAAEDHLIRRSGAYPLCGRGDINTYALFVERMRLSMSSRGRTGCIVPSGIATDDTTKYFFRDLMASKSLVSLYSIFETREYFLDTDSRVPFCLLTLTGCGAPADSSEFSFFLRRIEDRLDVDRRLLLTADDIRLLNPESETAPVMKSARDLRLLRAMYSRAAFLEGTEIHGYYIRLIDLGDHANHVRFVPNGVDQFGDITLKPTYLPLYESKMITLYEHRFGTFAGVSSDDRKKGITNAVSALELANPSFTVKPRYLVDRSLFEGIIGRYSNQDGWLLVYRDVTNVASERTCVCAAIPLTPATRSLPAIGIKHSRDKPLLLANMASIVFDYAARQKVPSNHLTFGILKQLPVLPVRAYDPSLFLIDNDSQSLRNWLVARVLELTYTAWDLADFAASTGFSGPPFAWNADRRFLIRSELDAAYFHFYGLSREDVAYTLDAFPLLRRNDERELSEYRTKRVILEIYDAMAEAERTGLPYQTRLDPPPADPRCCHPRKKIGILAFGSLIQDPGPELAPRIVMRLKTPTPFPVEYARISGKTRGGAPTLVPHDSGSPVSAEILVLDEEVSVDEARDMLWRRERRKTAGRETYTEGTTTNSVLVRRIDDFPSVSTMLYTDFHADGKIQNPTPDNLAACAIRSVREADEGKDGISYLMNAIRCGIETPLTTAYRAEILNQAEATSLEEAIRKAKGQ